ncbi:hypothetical protein ACF0H5_012222 [Mactra antiquata]
MEPLPSCPESTSSNFVEDKISTQILDSDKQTVIDIDSNEEFPSLPSSPNVPSDSYMNCPTIFHSTILQETTELSDTSNPENVQSLILNESIVRSDNTDQESIKLNSISSESIISFDEENSSVTEENSKTESLEYGMEKCNGKFLTCDKLIDILSTDTNKPILPGIPTSKKENVYFLTDHTEPYRLVLAITLIFYM